MSNKKVVYDIKGIKDALDVDEFFSISDLTFLNVLEKFNEYYIYDNNKYKIAFLIKDNKISQKTYLNDDFKPHRVDGPANIIFSECGNTSVLEFLQDGAKNIDYKVTKIINSYNTDNNNNKIEYLYTPDNYSLLPTSIIYDSHKKEIFKIFIFFNNKIIRIFSSNDNEVYNSIYKTFNELDDLKDLSSIADTLKIFEMELY